jgi:hypothetical protein
MGADRLQQRSAAIIEFESEPNNDPTRGARYELEIAKKKHNTVGLPHAKRDPAKFLNSFV